MNNSHFLEMYEFYRRQMVHEDSLVNYRVTWCLLIQAALATLVAVVNSKSGAQEKAACALHPSAVTGLLSMLGVITTIYTLLGIYAAVRASGNLASNCEAVRKQWLEWRLKYSGPSFKSLPIPDYSRGGGTLRWHRLGLIFGPWGFVLPGLVAWPVIFFASR
jgi:hypothetical protein